MPNHLACRLKPPYQRANIEAFNYSRSAGAVDGAAEAQSDGSWFDKHRRAHLIQVSARADVEAVKKQLSNNPKSKDVFDD